MIADPQVFDYYHQMLNGPTKYEWNRYESHHVSLEQTFLDRRSGVEIAFARDRVDSGGILGGKYALNLDVNELMPDGSPNPNFLRPITLGGGFKRVYSKDRDAARITGYYTLDLRKMGGPEWLSRFLGRHQFNTNYSRWNSL